MNLIHIYVHDRLYIKKPCREHDEYDTETYFFFSRAFGEGYGAWGASNVANHRNRSRKTRAQCASEKANTCD